MPDDDRKFKERFILCMAAGLMFFVLMFFFCILFVTIPAGNKDYVNMILGALIGSGLTVISTFFWGSSKGSQEQTTAKIDADKALQGGADDKVDSTP